jgi:hypothetical protein
MGRVFEFIPELQSLNLTNPTTTEVDLLDARRHLTLNSINTIQELFNSKQSLPSLRSWDELIEYQDCSTPLCDLKFALIQDQIFQHVLSSPLDEHSKLLRFNLNPYNLFYFFDPLFNSFDQMSLKAKFRDPYLIFLSSESKAALSPSHNYRIFFQYNQPIWPSLVELRSDEFFSHIRKHLCSDSFTLAFEIGKLHYESIVYA